jgi:hypothetical protein
MRRDQRRSVPGFERLEARALLATVGGTIAGTLLNGPLAGPRTPPGDWRIVGSGSVRPLGRVHASGINPDTPDDGVPVSLILSSPRGLVRLAILSLGADTFESTVPVQVRITGRSPGLGVRPGAWGTGTLAEGEPTPGGTIPFRLTFHIP